MVYEINYANEAYYNAQKYHEKVAKKKGGFDKIISYNPQMLDEEFKEKNSLRLSNTKGGGYWIWKSHVINMTLKQMKEGDYLFYCDTGAVIRHSIHKMIKVMENNHDNIMVFEVYGKKEREWTKRDIFTYFDYATEECKESNQIMGGFILIKKCLETERIFKEYEEACLTGNLITDDENELGLPNFEGFHENRHDQSILSVLLKKNGIKPYRDPSQFGLFQSIKYLQHNLNSDNDYEVYKRSKYPVYMFALHRHGKVRNDFFFIFWYIRWNYEIMKEYLEYWFDRNRAL